MKLWVKWYVFMAGIIWVINMITIHQIIYTSVFVVSDDICDIENPAVILPLYLYDHSGITISTKPFSCPWDSGQVGFIYATKDAVCKEFRVKEITDEIIQKVTEILEDEVNLYDKYLTGEIYCYNVLKVEKCSLGHEHSKKVWSCGEFYDIDECMKDAEEIVKEVYGVS